MDIIQILRDAVARDASDIFLIPGRPLSFKLNGQIVLLESEPFPLGMIDESIRIIYELADKRDIGRLLSRGDDDFSFALRGISRFRVSAFKQRGSLAAVIRVVQFELPDYEALHIPPSVIDVSKKTKGLALVTGPAGSGKSTTLACIIDAINHTRSAHIITLEDPIEYLHRHDRSIVTQREIGTDCENYVQGLRAALRQAPDVILLGEMRDGETIKTAVTAAETGHLVISTLHTIGAANTVDRMIDSFPPEQQRQIRLQLSMLLIAIVSQQLVPTLDGNMIPAFEVVYLNDALRNMIREAKTPQIDATIRSSADLNIHSMDDSLFNLYQEGVISRETLFTYCGNTDFMDKRLGQNRL